MPINNEKLYTIIFDIKSVERTSSKTGRIILKAVRQRVGATIRAKETRGERSTMSLPHN